MSTDTVQPIIIKRDANSPSWLSKATAIVVAILGIIKAIEEARKPVNPVINPPAPVVVHDDTVVVPPRPQPTPIPVPEPQPPTPIVPHTGVVVEYLSGKTITDTVEPGFTFAVSGGSGVNLTGTTDSPDDADIVDVSDSKLLVTLRNSATLTVIVTGGGEKPRLISIRCNHAPQPPPPIPVNPPSPDPAPVPNAGVRVLFLRDAMQGLTAGQVAAMDSPKVTDLLNAKCAKDSDGRPAWHRWDSKVDASKLPGWSKVVDAVRAKVASDPNVKYPLLVIDDGRQLHLFVVSDEASTLATLNTAFGGVSK
jgi:hypothetical protein